jgi:hypothetical protein
MGNELSEPATQTAQNDLLQKALAEPQVAEVMAAYERAAKYLPPLTPSVISQVSFSTGANA